MLICIKKFLEILIIFKVDTLLMYHYEEIEAPYTHTHTHTHLISTRGKSTLVFIMLILGNQKYKQ